MTLAIKSTPNLYKSDFALWLEDTAHKLRSGNLQELDIESLLEEILGLSGSQKHEIESRLDIIISHILKRCHVDLPDCDRGWEITIRTQRKELKRLLKQSPSLRNYLISVFEEIHQEALVELREDYPSNDFSDTWQFSYDVDAILNNKFWEYL